MKSCECDPTVGFLCVPCAMESEEIQKCWNRIIVLEKKLQIAYHTLQLIDDNCIRDNTSAWSLASNALEEMDSIEK